MTNETEQAIDQVNPEPAACSLDAAGAAHRRERWLRLADRALIDKEASERGVRQCCSFAPWSVHSSERSLVLEVSTDPPRASIVWALFELQGLGQG